MKNRQAFQVTAYTCSQRMQYSAIAESSVEAALDAVDLFGDEPCSIFVKPLKVAQ
jgi:hypothetical protein